MAAQVIAKTKLEYVIFVPANNDAATRQAGSSPPPFPCRRSRCGRQRFLRRLPVPCAQGNTGAAIVFGLLDLVTSIQRYWCWKLENLENFMIFIRYAFVSCCFTIRYFFLRFQKRRFFQNLKFTNVNEDLGKRLKSLAIGSPLRRTLA